jgi:integrase
MKIDPYKDKERYFNWKEKVKDGIPEISKFNSDIILIYLDNMEHGINISSTNKKGCRSYIRLNTLREKMVFFSKKFKEKYNLDRIIDIKEDDLIKFFSEMSNGTMKRKDNKNYLSLATYVKVFKSFWHWHQKVSKKNGEEIPDITTDLDSRQDKPKWVYLTEEQVKKLCDNAKYEYRVLIMFLFDTGIRSPTELINVKVSDLYNDCKELQIREEISKTFGRKIKLMLCSEMIKTYIQDKKFGINDHLFLIKPNTVNRYLQRLALRVFGDSESLAGQKYSEITMYDFRHISCCYWLPRYKSESALKYRFGWKKSDKIHYYSEMLGMKDTISEEDLFLDTTKGEMRMKIDKADREKEIMQEKINSLEEQMKTILGLVKEMVEKTKT